MKLFENANQTIEISSFISTMDYKKFVPPYTKFPYIFVKLTENKTNQTIYNKLSENVTLSDINCFNELFIREYEQEFTAMLRGETSECGDINPSEEYFTGMIEKDKEASLQCINKIFMRHYSLDKMDVDLLINILHLLSHFKHSDVSPNAETMAIAALSHKNSKDELGLCKYALKCFDNWRNPEFIKTLKAIEFGSEWLKEYADDIIEELNKISNLTKFSDLT